MLSAPSDRKGYFYKLYDKPQNASDKQLVLPSKLLRFLMKNSNIAIVMEQTDRLMAFEIMRFRWVRQHTIYDSCGILIFIAFTSSDSTKLFLSRE